MRDSWAVKDKEDPQTKLERQKSVAKSIAKSVKNSKKVSNQKLAIVKGLSLISPIQSPAEQAKKPILGEQAIFKP